MIKKTITYTDYNNVNRTEDFYFNLTITELMEMQLNTTGGTAEMIQKAIDAQDNQSIFKIFKDLLLKAYGEKSADGKRFMKVNDDGVPLYIAFAQTEAYSNLFMELVTNGDAASTFINSIIPPQALALANENQKTITMNETN